MPVHIFWDPLKKKIKKIRIQLDRLNFTLQV